MTKNKGGFLFFDKQEDIDIYLDELFEKVEEELKNCRNIHNFSDILAITFDN